MEIQKIKSSLKRLHPYQSVVLRFKEDGTRGLLYLSMVIEQSGPRTHFDDRSALLAHAVHISRSWGSSDRQNRSYCVYGLQYAQADWLDLIFKYVESIEPSEHAARGLSSGRQKRREEAAQALVGQILTDDLTDELREWGIDCKANISTLEDGTQVLTFDLKLDEKSIGKVVIDSFSGRIAQNDVWGDEIFEHHDQAQDAIRAVMEKALESMTT